MSLREIAKNLGISITTASRALGGYSDVAATTRERVQAEAKRIGYVPNEVARRLQSGRSDVLGVVLPPGPTRFSDLSSAQILDGAWSRIAGTELDLMVMSAPEDAGEVTHYKRLVVSRRVDGLILTRLRSNDPRVDFLRSARFPFVVIGPPPEGDREVIFLQADVQGAMISMADHLAGLGHRHVALLCGSTSFLFVEECRAGFEAAAAARDMRVTVHRGELDENGGRAMAQAVLAENPRPTAAVAVINRVAIGAAQGFIEGGLVIGRDISLAAFGDSPMAQFFNPPITSVSVPIEEMGAHAVDVLLDLRDGITPTVASVWPTTLMARASTGPAPDRRTEPPGEGAHSAA